MKSSFVARIGLAAAVLAAPLVVFAAPAQADPHPNACLVVENNTPNVLNIRLKNRLWKGNSWTISPWDTTILTDNDRAIATSDGDWNVIGPAGDWRFEPDQNNVRWGCSGSWVFTVN
ncbi:hypothetical protein [Nocardia jejuensis]|uniref:hypothetical protein n=1 Tax=Nocardia jejuensis TaxID=328049 RepID=UPI0012F9C9AD|nr:hypothetical protein [Nocardia jejuensis]